jgi:transcriptional antiterminator NusG
MAPQGVFFLILKGIVMTFATSSTAPWYLLQVQSNFEDKVADALRAGIQNQGLEKAIHAVLVPKEEVQGIKDGRRHITQRRLYPGYLMVQMDFSDTVWHFLKKTPRVLGFIGGARPSAMKAHEVTQIFNLMDASVEAPKPKVEFSPGQTVRIVEGPFKDFNGVIDRVDYSKSRLHVSVTIFGRSTPLELTFADISVD